MTNISLCGIAGTSIQSLFGKFCSGQTFEHDQETSSYPQKHGILPTQERTPSDTGSHESSGDGVSRCRRSLVVDTAISVGALDANQNQGDGDSPMMEPLVHADIRSKGEISPDPAVISDAPQDNTFPHVDQQNLAPQEIPPTTNDAPAFASNKRPFPGPRDENHDDDNGEVTAGGSQSRGEHDSQRTDASTDSSYASPYQTLSRYEAYHAMLSNSAGTTSWMPISLLSTDANHGVADTEL